MVKFDFIYENLLDKCIFKVLITQTLLIYGGPKRFFDRFWCHQIVWQTRRFGACPVAIKVSKAILYGELYSWL